jgi:hypothetical protein
MLTPLLAALVVALQVPGSTSRSITSTCSWWLLSLLLLLLLLLQLHAH